MSIMSDEVKIIYQRNLGGVLDDVKSAQDVSFENKGETWKSMILLGFCRMYILYVRSTDESRPSGSFFTQVDHLFSANSFRNKVIHSADFFTLKISEPSDHCLKSYGQKVNF